MASFNEYMAGLSRQPAPRRQMLPLDQILGGVSGLNRSALRMADTLVGNPLAGLYNSLADSPIEANPMLRLAQQYGVGRDAINPQQAQAQALTGSVGDMAASMVPGAGDISGLAQDITAMAKDKIPVNPLTVGLAATGALPLVPPLLRMVPPRMWQNPGNDAMHGQAGALMYHGTPHTWAPEPGFPEGRPRFDASTAKTGEGAMVYGPGFYAAENPNVARQYAENLGGTEFRDASGEVRYTMPAKKRGPLTPELRAANSLDYSEHMKFYRERGESNPYAYAEEHLRKFADEESAKEAAQVLSDWEAAGVRPVRAGNAYQFDFPDELMPNLLDLDKQIAYQPGLIEKLRSIAVNAPTVTSPYGSGASPAQLEEMLKPEMQRTPDDFITMLQDAYDGDVQRAIDAFLDAGIPGSQFLDAGSRSAGGTHNYVLFKPQDFVKDVKKL